MRPLKYAAVLFTSWCCHGGGLFVETSHSTVLQWIRSVTALAVKHRDSVDGHKWSQQQ